jgi:hypothetical protein
MRPVGEPCGANQTIHPSVKRLQDKEGANYAPENLLAYQAGESYDKPRKKGWGLFRFYYMG